jgi:bifunctional ADP-heptose synthase (sugar kinase/adenylyltransferase)
LEQAFRSSDGLIVLDQLVDEDCGVVNTEVRGTLARLSAEHPEKLIFVDSRRFLGKFRFGVLKGNRSEIVGTAGEGNSVETSLDGLARQTGRPAYCTLGEQGILVARPGREPTLVPSSPVNGPIDIVGAGDAATSGIVTALLAGADELEAAALGNLVASITIRQLGKTGTATPQQVRERWVEAYKK